MDLKTNYESLGMLKTMFEGSGWEEDDLNRVLHHFSGNTDSAVNAILEHEEKGKDPSELLPIEPSNPKLNLLVEMFRFRDDKVKVEGAGTGTGTDRVRGWTRWEFAEVLHMLDDDTARVIDAVLEHGSADPSDLIERLRKEAESDDDDDDDNQNDDDNNDGGVHVQPSFDSDGSAVGVTVATSSQKSPGSPSSEKIKKSMTGTVFDAVAVVDDDYGQDESSKNAMRGTDSSNIEISPAEEEEEDSRLLNGEITFRERCCTGKRKKYWTSGIITIIIISISLLAASLKRIKSTQYGVEYDVWAKTLDVGVQQSGLYLGPIGFKFIKFPSIQIHTDVEDTCLSRDGLRINFKASYQYRLEKEQILDAVLSFRNYETWKGVTDSAANSGIQTACSDWNVTDFQINRKLVQESMFDEVRKKLEGDGDDNDNDNDNEHGGIYAEAVALQLTMFELPPEYVQAIVQKQAAKEDISLVMQQRTQEIVRANTMLLVAEREAEIVMNRAHNAANITLTKAGFTANQTRFMFEQEAVVLSQARNFLSLDGNGVLGFMSNKLYQQVPGLRASMMEPVMSSLRARMRK